MADPKWSERDIPDQTGRVVLITGATLMGWALTVAWASKPASTNKVREVVIDVVLLVKMSCTSVWFSAGTKKSPFG